MPLIALKQFDWRSVDVKYQTFIVIFNIVEYLKWNIYELLILMMRSKRLTICSNLLYQNLITIPVICNIMIKYFIKLL